MHGFLHIMLIGANSGTIIASYDNLSLDNMYFNLKFQEILADQGILLTDQEWLENTPEIQIQLENVKFPLVYHFAHNKTLILVVVATRHVPQMSQLLEGLLEDLEMFFVTKYTIPPIPLTSSVKSATDSLMFENLTEKSVNGINGDSFDSEIIDTVDKSVILNSSQQDPLNSQISSNSLTSTKIQIPSPITSPSTQIMKDQGEIPFMTPSDVNGESTDSLPLEYTDMNSNKEGYSLKFDFLYALAQSMSKFLLPNFLIPEKRIEVSEYLAETHSEAIAFIHNLVQEKWGLDFDQQIWQKVDGTWTIQEFADVHNIEIQYLREILFFLWKSEIITLRLPYQKWDIFRSTIKAPLFLDEGSTENLLLIGKYNSRKIIQLLAFIGEGCSYSNLIKNFDMTQTKLGLYLSELVQRQIILRKEYKPVMVHIPEDLIPLLTMQGFNKSDFGILNQLAFLLDGSKSLQSTALNLKIDPNQLKVLLDKYETAVKIIT